MKSEFLREASERGFIDNCTDIDGLDAALGNGPISVYVGFDCTANSLHVGSLVQIMLLRLLQRHGHRPLILLGGGTSRIGDPSGKDESRQLLTDEQIADNMSGIRRCFEPFLRFRVDHDGNRQSPRWNDAMMVNNADWLDELNYISMLRDVGAHFTINRMLGFDSVRNRLEREQPLTFLEFNYMILQSYDFRELNRRHGVVLQIGGSDQWGNIVSGMELTRRTDGKTLFGLTTPLITVAGNKMGKTAQGAIWLTGDRLSAFDYWQFWRNTNDADVSRFLRLFTDLPLSVIAQWEQSEINAAKKELATQATALAHGRDAAVMAAETARLTFDEHEVTDTLPTVEIDIASGVPAFRLLVMTGLVTSNAAARRLIRDGGARINDVPIKNESEMIIARSAIKVSVGKKTHRLVRPLA